MTQSPNEQTKLVGFLRDTLKTDPSFPHEDNDYYSRFQQLDKYLNAEVHPIVNQGATAKGDGWLTDHGKQHITTVIRRASELVADGESVFLTPYETFLLLVAIHFHDAGNIFGRDKHEKRISKLMQELDESIIGSDGVEKRMIRDIAMAHGGYADTEGQDKDTISRLSWDSGSGALEPRVQLLAAVLRFADELADDHTRTSRFLIDNKLVRRSQAYHTYADRLRKVTLLPEDRKVSLVFELDATHATTKYWKGRRKVYLYDEIVERSLKMHREHLYCLRFMQPYVWIDTIDVSITITTENYMKVLEKITFSLIQRGYPDQPTSLSEVGIDVAALTGKTLHKNILRLSKKVEDG